MNPFGTGNPRFEYQKQPKKQTQSTDMNNGMISVKDKDVMDKRFAFQKTIELHKKMQDMVPNAIFKSNVTRQCSPNNRAETIRSGVYDFEKTANQTVQTRTTNNNTYLNSTLKSIQNDKQGSFGLFNDSQNPYESTNSSGGGARAAGQDPGYAMLLSEHIGSKQHGFNATQPRFDYVKEELRMGEVPGPGAYNRYNTQEGVKRYSPNKQDGHTANFKDSTSRDDYKSYLAHEKKKAPIAPSDYFVEQRPFLKKTFNASLPKPNFY